MVNAVDVVQEIVPSDHCRFGCCQERVSDLKHMCYENKVSEYGEVGSNKQPSNSCSQGDAKLEFVADGKKCNMKIFDADVSRFLDSSSAIVDDGNVVVFRPQESYVENTSTGQRISMKRKNHVLVVHLDERPDMRTTRTVRFDEPNLDERTAGSQVQKKLANAVKQRLKQERKCGSRRWTVLNTRSQRNRILVNKGNRKYLNPPFRSWCSPCIKGKGCERRTVGKQLKKRDMSQKSIWTTCSWATKKETLTFWVPRERATRAVLSTVVPRKPTGEWVCRRLTARLGEIGLEFVDITVKSGNEPALTGLIESWSTLRALKKWIEDDHREHSFWMYIKQRDRCESDSICAGNDQNDTQRD